MLKLTRSIVPIEVFGKIRPRDWASVSDTFIMQMVADYNKYFRLTISCECNSIRLCEDCIKKARTIISF